MALPLELPNGYRDAAREVKVRKLADYLQFAVQIANSAAAARLSDFGWRMVTVGADRADKQRGGRGVRVPSLITRARIVEMLARRERITCQGLRLDPYFGPRLVEGGRR